jgi:hypothetical protein
LEYVSSRGSLNRRELVIEAGKSKFNFPEDEEAGPDSPNKRQFARLRFALCVDYTKHHEEDIEGRNLGKFAACRRVARAIYLGSAPLTQAAHRGLEDRRVKLGCVMPGESPAVFGDALRRLAGAATYLYQDGPRYGYSTQPTVTKLAEDRAEQLKRDPDKVVHELDLRLRKNLEQKGDFSRIHPMPQSGQDVPDDLDARLVVLGVDHAYSREPNSAAETAAKAIFESRGKGHARN